MRKPITAETTEEDLAADPEAYGLPDLMQFIKHRSVREKYMGRDDGQMTMLTEGPKLRREDLEKTLYFVNGKQLSGEDEVDRALGDYGYTLADIDMHNRNSRLRKEMDVIPKGGGKYDIKINFITATAV